MEDKSEEVEDIESASGDSFIADSDDDAPSTSGQDDKLHIEVSWINTFSFLHNYTFYFCLEDY